MEEQRAGPPLESGQEAKASFIMSKGVQSAKRGKRPFIVPHNNGAVTCVCPAIFQNGRTMQPLWATGTTNGSDLHTLPNIQIYVKTKLKV